MAGLNGVKVVFVIISSYHTFDIFLYLPSGHPFYAKFPSGHPVLALPSSLH